MEIVPLSEAKTGLSSFVDLVESTHDRVKITRHGRTAAVLISADDLDSLEETVALLSVPGLRERVEDARQDIAQGEYVTSADDARARIAALRAARPSDVA